MLNFRRQAIPVPAAPAVIAARHFGDVAVARQMLDMLGAAHGLGPAPLAPSPPPAPVVGFQALAAFLRNGDRAVTPPSVRR